MYRRLDKLALNMNRFTQFFDTSGTTKSLYLDAKINHSLFTPLESSGISLREPRTGLNREDGHFPVLSFLGVQGILLRC